MVARAAEKSRQTASDAFTYDVFRATLLAHELGVAPHEIAVAAGTTTGHVERMLKSMRGAR